MTDRELLELAAKAAGMHANQWAERGELVHSKGGWVQFYGYGQVVIWNPLTDDGDALRLAVKLRLDIVDFKGTVIVKWGEPGQIYRHHTEALGDDPYAATRRAIVRAAAEIGKTA